MQTIYSRIAAARKTEPAELSKLVRKHAEGAK